MTGFAWRDLVNTQDDNDQTLLHITVDAWCRQGQTGKRYYRYTPKPINNSRLLWKRELNNLDVGFKSFCELILEILSLYYMEQYKDGVCVFWLAGGIDSCFGNNDLECY